MRTCGYQYLCSDTMNHVFPCRFVSTAPDTLGKLSQIFLRKNRGAVQKKRLARHTWGRASPQKKQTPHLSSAEKFKVRGIEFAPHEHSPRKRPPQQIHKSIIKKENQHLQIKRVGCILDLGEIKEFLPKNRLIIRLMRPDFRLLFPSLK